MEDIEEDTSDLVEARLSPEAKQIREEAFTEAKRKKIRYVV